MGTKRDSGGERQDRWRHHSMANTRRQLRQQSGDRRLCVGNQRESGRVDQSVCPDKDGRYGLHDQHLSDRLVWGNWWSAGYWPHHTQPHRAACMFDGGHRHQAGRVQLDGSVCADRPHQHY